MIISGGFNVYPKAVENLLTTHPDVETVVVRRPGRTVDAEELKTTVKESNGSVNTPKSVDFVEALSLTVLGKADKKTLRDRYWHGHTRSVN